MTAPYATPLPALTKSDFLAFRECAKSFWIQRHRPWTARPTPSAFDQLLMRDGYAVEAMAQTLFEARGDADTIARQVELSCGRCFVRADFVKTRPDRCIEIFEVKSSTSPTDHIVDACFQKIVAERAGFTVAAVHIVHVDPEFRRSGPVDPARLLIVAPVTDAIALIQAEVEGEVDRALELVAMKAIDEQGCECMLKSRSHHCANFLHFHPDYPERPIHSLPRMHGLRLAELVASGRLSIDELAPADVTASQLPVLTAMQSRRPVIDAASLKAFLDALVFPLHFYDYETAGSAIPAADGHGPHEQVPVQFSVHVLSDDGRLEHHEFLAPGHGDEAHLAEALRAAIGESGTALAWNESFEKGCNRRLARLLPAHAPFLEDLNERTVDLMVPFKKDYVHPDFDGSTSIKKVLPVLVPSLSYDGMPVHDGAGAILAFRQMIETSDLRERSALRGQLLTYCRLDTLAMVEIHQHLCRTCK